MAVESDLKLRRISDPGGTPSISANIDIPVATTAVPLSVPHKGSDGRLLDAVDDRLMNAVLRNGQLWTTHAILADATGVGTASGDRDAVRWYQIGSLDTAPAVSQFGTVVDGAASNPNYYFMPSINVSAQGNMALGGTVAGTNTFAGAWTAGRFAGDALGTTGTPTVYEPGFGAYNPVFQNFPDDPHRWGDYSFTSVDPTNGMTMWTIQESANTTNSWGVIAGVLQAPPPATPTTVVPASVPAGLPSVDVRVTGTSVAGSGFFDTPPGYARHISASVGSDVTVNSVRYESPTSVVLNLNTVGAVQQGPRTITITNPDGLGMSGFLFLEVTAAEGLLRVTTNPALPSQFTLNGSRFPTDSWGLNWLSVPAGIYDLDASHVEGFTEPATQRLTVTAGATVTVQENFTQRGELRVVTSPAVPAPISVDGITREDWGMFTDLPTGSHQVCFGPTAGFDVPLCQTVTLIAGQLSTITGNYTANPQAQGSQGTGLLRVTTSPALPSQILVNGVPMDSWGLNWADLPPGQYTVAFTHVEGFTEPAPQTVTVTAGQTTAVSGVFTQRGELRVITSPAVPATITVDGNPRNNWGVFTDVPVGSHEVCFGWAPGKLAPPCQTVTVTAGALTTVTGSYTAGP